MLKRNRRSRKLFWHIFVIGEISIGEVPGPPLTTPMLQLRKTKKVFANFPRGFWRFSTKFQRRHRAGQRCFELLALIGSPQLSFSKVFPAEQTSWPNWQTLWTCTEADP